MMKVEVIGQNVIDRIFAKLPFVIGKKVVMRSFRKGATILVKAARSKVAVSNKKGFIGAFNDYSKGAFSTFLQHHTPGQLKRSIGTITGKPYKGLPSLWVGPRKGGKRKDNGWYGHFVEFGTDGYTVKEDRIIATPNGVIKLAKGTHIPGQSPQPFMRPSWDSKKIPVSKKISEVVEIELKKELNKLAV